MLETASQLESELQKRRRFSAHRLADGTFWDDPQNHSLSDHEKASHQSLIQAIVETDQALRGESNPALRRLLLLMVLIKYLEDREVFPRPAWFGHYHKGARSFFDVLKGGEPDSVLRLLRTLEDKFNGDVFALPTGTPLTKESLRDFANLVESRTLNQQRYLWEQFSFAHLPVEVISHLYQRFVKGSTAVYTPPFLAALLLDYAMPYARLTGKERILDPACGSGVFLVGAFRRLVNVWRSKHQSHTLDVETLKSILRRQIFGVELDSNAVDLTAFSLSLALCDCLQPNVIWNELRFDPLRDHNLVEADFFECTSTDKADDRRSIGQFDVIVGNPPFESEFSEPARYVNANRGEKQGTIPDKQIAHLFLDHCIQFVRPKGRLCLIQPSGFLYNLQTHAFRRYMAQMGRIQTILDFTSIRGLYDGADPKTLAVMGGHEASNSITHLTFRRTFETKQRIGFVLDHYDRHTLSVDDVVRNPFIGRSGLLGGGRLRCLSEKLRKLPTLREFAERNGWEYGEGFIAASTGRRVAAPFLTGMKFLPSDGLAEEGINIQKLSFVSETEFRSAYSEDRYAAPLLLIKKHEKLYHDVWRRGTLAYRAQIVGLHPAPGDEKLFDKFVKSFRSHIRTMQFAVALNGSRGLAAKATAIEKQDIDNLPSPACDSELQLVHWERVLEDDTIDYVAEFVRRGQNSELLRKAADADVLKHYSTLYCRMLHSIYDNLRASDPVFLDGLICQPFYFGDEPAVEWLGQDCEEQLRALVFEQSTAALRTVRVVRFYHENVVFILKPDRLRYWIRSTAIRDADDTLTDLRRQGY
jgi:methylase of polypeptide subunit release factors